jgi:hypothetical protein
MFAHKGDFHCYCLVVKAYLNMKHHQVSRKEKDTRCVVFCTSKGYEATEVAHRNE